MPLGLRLKHFLFLLCLYCTSCSTSVKTIDDYNSWLNDKDNGCIKTKTIAGINIGVKYQPPSYIVLKQLKTEKRLRNISRDSLLSAQDKLVTFLITLGPDKAEDKDRRAGSVMYEGVADKAGYNERVMQMNFFMEQYMALYIDGKKRQPVLALVENLYELSESRTFVCVFAPGSETDDLLSGKEYLFEYNDPFFNMGKVQLDFSGQRLAAAREVKVSWD